MSAATLTEIESLVGRSDDADEILRAVVAALARADDVTWSGILFLEEGELVLGPEDGTPDPSRRVAVPVAYRGTVVGQVAVDGAADEALLQNVADLISTHVLLGWDTGGETWEP